MTEITSPLKAIRAKCYDCVVTAKEIELCSSPTCELFPFRFGKNPYIKHQLTEEQKEQRRVQLKKAREMQHHG